MSLSKIVTNFLGLTTALIPLVGSAVFVPAEAAEQWVRLFSNNDGSLYIDAASIRGNGRYRYYWQQVVLQRPVTDNGRYGNSSTQMQAVMMYSSVDCRTKITRIRRVLMLDNNGTAIMEMNMNNDGPIENLNRMPRQNRFAANYACSRR